MTIRYRTGALLCAAALAGCGGGGGASSPSLPAASAPARATAKVQFSITVPAATGAPYRTIRPKLGATRRPAYVSPGTTMIEVLLVPSGGGAPTPLGSATIAAPGSGTTQGVTVSAPVGSDTFEIQLLDGTGHLLSDGQATATIGYGQPNQVAVTALGVPAYVTMSPSTVTPPLDGQSHTIPLNVSVYDADGYPIAGTFASSLTLGLQGPVNDYTLSTTTLASASDAASATVTFDGTQTAPVRIFVLGVAKAFAAATTFRGGALPTGNALLAVDTTGAVSRVDARTYAVSTVGSATAGGAAFTSATALAASPDGHEALIGRSDGQLAYYDGAQKTITGTLNTGEASVLALAFEDTPSVAWVLTTTTGGGYAVVPIQIGTGGVTGALVGAPSTLPSSAQRCGALSPVSYGGGVAVACTDATYDFVPGGSWSSTAPGTAALAQQTLGSMLLGAAYNGTTYSGLVGFNVGGSALTQAATYPSANGSPIALDTTSQIVYAGVYNGVAAYDVSPGATGGTLGTATLGTQPVAIADYPGLYGGTQPVLGDATVWAAESTGSVAVITTTNFSVAKTVSVGSSLTGIGFVP